MRGILPATWSGPLMSVMRIVFGLFFLMHGTQKYFNWPAAMPMEVEVVSWLGLAGILELVGGTLMILGLFTRPVAFVLACEMAVAYFWVHIPNGGIWPLNNGGEPAALYCFAFLFFAAAGPGTIAIDKPHMDPSKHQ